MVMDAASGVTDCQVAGLTFVCRLDKVAFSGSTRKAQQIRSSQTRGKKNVHSAWVWKTFQSGGTSDFIPPFLRLPKLSRLYL